MRIVEEPPTTLDDYGSVSPAFEVRSLLDVSTPLDGLGGLVLTERHLDRPYVKDYDAEPDNRPVRWAARFDISRWAFFGASSEGQRVGGAAVAFGTPELPMLEGRQDLAVLWDLRVVPSARGQGVGSALLRAAESWAKARACRQLKVETQNINVPACRFYRRHGFVLGAIDRFAYPSLPDEAQLLWYKDLAAKFGSSCRQKSSGRGAQSPIREGRRYSFVTRRASASDRQTPGSDPAW
jgi:GNAT superfamily N-acetyltransferase